MKQRSVNTYLANIVGGDCYINIVREDGKRKIEVCIKYICHDAGGNVLDELKRIINAATEDFSKGA